MRSLWVWMMVLVALGSALKPPKQMPNLKIQKLKGFWYVLATAHLSGSLRAPTDYRIIPEDEEIFLWGIPPHRPGVCDWKTAAATRNEGYFRTDNDIKEYMYFVDTDYTNYHIVYIQYDRYHVLYLYGRSRVLTGHMKTRFAIMVDQLGINPKHVNYEPKTECRY